MAEPATPQAKPPVSAAPVADKNDVEQNKVYAILAYLGILVLVPLLAAKESPYAQFHANQGLLLFLAGIALSFAWFILAFIPFIGWLLSFSAWVLLLVLAIMGIVNAAQGEMKKLPIIGDIQLIK